MHAETLAYMLHQLPLEKKIRQSQAEVGERPQPLPESIGIPEGDTTLGLFRGDAEFGWGLLLGAPLAAVLKTVADRIPRMEAIGELLGGADPPKPPAEPEPEPAPTPARSKAPRRGARVAS